MTILVVTLCKTCDFVSFSWFFPRSGYRHMVFSNTTSRSPQPSLYESPVYERSYKGHAACVRFRYLVYGPGKQFLRLYQQLDLLNHTSRLMWAVNESNNTEVVWKYGRVAVPSVTKYKVRKRMLRSFRSVCVIIKVISLNT